MRDGGLGGHLGSKRSCFIHDCYLLPFMNSLNISERLKDYNFIYLFFIWIFLR